MMQSSTAMMKIVAFLSYSVFDKLHDGSQDGSRVTLIAEFDVIGSPPPRVNVLLIVS